MQIAIDYDVFKIYNERLNIYNNYKFIADVDEDILINIANKALTPFKNLEDNIKGELNKPSRNNDLKTFDFTQFQK